jgi:hypothetical protein
VAELDVRHRQAQRRLSGALTRSLAVLIAGLPDPTSQEAMELYSSESLRLVAGGQQQAAQLAIAYMTILSPPARRRLPASTARALAGGVAVTPDSPVTRSPVLRLWERIEAGDELPVAQASASSYAGGLASGDLAVAERGGLNEGERAGSRPVRGYSKELSGAACDWCRSVAGRVYRSADAVPFHQRDRCSVAPVFNDQEVEQ